VSARHVVALLSVAAGLALAACSGEVVVEPPEGGAGDGGDATAGGGGTGNDYDCGRMCDAWIAKYPQCDVDKCSAFCSGMLAQGEAEGCLPEAIACLDRYPEDSGDCAGGCGTAAQPWVDCLAE
jgi:hypothetical protein